MSFERSLRNAIETGDVRFGVAQCWKAVKEGDAKLLVLSSNCSDETLGEQDVKIHRFEGSNSELGRRCGKPFGISALVVVNEGESDIISSI